MPRTRVQKSVAIGAPPEKVRASVRDFRQWPRWSPWLVAEPECDVAFAEDGSSYSWDGRIVGAGGMTVVDEAPRSIRYRLEFTRPWNSTGDVEIQFGGKDGGTEVVWSLDGALPLPLFWMKRSMEAYLGMDFERGLVMLKDLVETGTVPSRLEFPGLREFPGFRFVGIETRCPIVEIGPRMEADLGRFGEWFEAGGPAPSGKPFSIYHEWRPAKGTVRYTLGFPVDDPGAGLPAGMAAGALPPCRVWVVRHSGPYRHLGNAWAAGYLHGRAKAFRHDRKIDPFEIYESQPDSVPEADTVTTLHFPVR